ncbi:MAG TPA: response regulator transcription factor [Terriglobales bacterium]|nr:response regulator transcription factor [Terriglobales bacterium]
MGSPASKIKQQSDPAASNAAENLQPIRVIIADTQSIYRVGIRKIFALEDDVRVVAQAETLGQTLAAVVKHPADVILFEAAITPNPPEAVSEILKKVSTAKVIVVLVEPDEDDTVDLLRRGVQGIVSRSISPDLLVKCVRKVAAGETWLDNKGVNWVLEAYRSQASQLTSPRPKTRISDKELLIISCVSQGMRNKEIAVELGTTEQVVKNYLRKIYDKLGVSDRLELALYCIHHHLLQNKGPNLPPVEADAPANPSPESATQTK